MLKRTLQLDHQADILHIVNCGTQFLVECCMKSRAPGVIVSGTGTVHTMPSLRYKLPILLDNGETKGGGGS